MWNTDANLLAALRGDHSVTTTVLSTDRITNITTPVEIISGKTSATLTAQVARTCQLTVEKSWLRSGVFDPLRSTITVRTGIPGLGEVPLGVYGVGDFTDVNTGSAQVNLVDFTDDVVNDEFSTPWAVTSDQYIATAMSTILLTASRGYTLNTSLLPAIFPQPYVFDTDRGKALDTLAASVNYLWMADRVGSFTTFRNPFAFAQAPSSIIALKDGVDGVVVSVRHTQSRVNLHNAITLMVERNNQAPIVAYVEDTDPRSPTFVRGGLGRRNKVIKTQTALNQTQATALAWRYLNANISQARSWQITVPHTPIFDPGDVVALWYDGDVTTQVIETVQDDLLAATTQLATRRLALDVNTIAL